MHILVTGANGFVGQKLVEQILLHPQGILGEASLERLTLIDMAFEKPIPNNKVHLLQGSFTDKDILQKATSELPVDLAFHLASLPSGATETNPSLSMTVNVSGVFDLLELFRKQGNQPTFIFTSSIAVYGKPSGEFVDENTPPSPNLSYGSQKIIGETMVADYTRRGWINGCSLRLPGIVARPPEPNGAISIFFSDLIRTLSTNQKFICPVSRDATAWLMSVECCVHNLIHASLNNSLTGTWTLPALYLSIGQLIEAIDKQFLTINVNNLISYQKDQWVEDNFGSYPPLYCHKAEKFGFKNDGNVEQLIKKSLECL